MKNIMKYLKINMFDYKNYQFFTAHHAWAIRHFLINQEKRLQDNSIIVDAGAGQCQYKEIFSKRHKYVAVDLGVGDKDWDFNHVDIVAPLDNIPLDSEYADVILLNQVLEHVYNPKEVLKELSRILKKQGVILGTVPQNAGEHQVPHDFFRYTRYSLKKMGEENGLQLVYLKPQGGIFIYTGALINSLPFHFFSKSKIIHNLILIVWTPFLLFINIVCSFLDLFDKEKLLTQNYEFIYKK